MSEKEKLVEELNEINELMFMEEMKDYIDWPYYNGLEQKQKELKEKIKVLEGGK